MKKIILLLTLCLSATIFVKACDICGCGVGNNYLGILPEFHKHIFGIRYRYNSLVTHVGVDGTTTYLTTNENYRTAELWSGFNIGKKIRLLTSLPYSFDERSNQGNLYHKNGLGDMAATAYYELINQRRSVNNKVLINSLWIGAGIKLPTGQYNPVDKGGAENNNLFQLGTGSTDFSINAMYDLRYQDAGLNLNAGYKINTPNRYRYRYGNKFTASGQFYYKFRIASKLTIAPNAGILYEDGQRDSDNKAIVDISGGRLVVSGLGMESTFGKIAFGVSWQTPLSQNIANGIIKANDRLMMHVSVML